MDKRIMMRDTSAQDKVLSAPKAKRSIKWILAGCTVIAICLYLVLYFSSSSVSVHRHNLRTAVVTKDTLVREVNATGKVVAINAPTLYSSASGTVKFVKQPGEAVKIQEVLARVNSPELINQFEQEKANLQTAKINLQGMALQGAKQKLDLKKTKDMARVKHTAAKRELARAESSFKTQVISSFDYQQAKDELATAELELDNAIQAHAINSDIIEFEYQSAELALERQQLIVDEFKRKIDQLTLRAPVEGIMGNWLVDQDSNVSENDGLLIVVDLSAYGGELEIPETYAEELSPGMAVEVRMGATIISGLLSSVSPEVVGNSVKAGVQFKHGQELNIRQNQRISAKILLENRPNVLQVAKGPYLQSGNFAYVIKDGVARRKVIKVGSRTLNRVEILSGLSVGEEIITSSVESFKEHQTININ